MLKQINYRGSFISKFALVAFCLIATGSLLFHLAQSFSLLKALISIVAIVIVCLVLYVNLYREALKIDEIYLYWRPIWSWDFLQIPIKNIKSAEVVSRPPLFDGLTILMNCRIVFSMGKKDFVIKFQMRQRDEELLIHLSNRAAQ
jgi:hypothetical protein